MGLAYTLKTKLRVKRQMRACISVAFQKGIGEGEALRAVQMRERSSEQEGQRKRAEF